MCCLFQSRPVWSTWKLNPDDPEEILRRPLACRTQTLDHQVRSRNGKWGSTARRTTERRGPGWPKGCPAAWSARSTSAVSADDPSRVYALVETRPDEEGLYRSNDRGRTWHMVTNQRGLMNRPFYYTNVDADPSNADIVYVNNEGFYRSEDGGKTFQRRSTPHGDNHDMWINPNDGDLFVQSNDGGANVTRDGGTHLVHPAQPADCRAVTRSISTTIFPIACTRGSRTTSTIAVPSLPYGTRAGGQTADWEAVGGCETGPVVPKPGNPDIVYANCKGRFGRFNRRTGQEQQYYVGAMNMYGRNPAELPYRFQRVVPIEVSPHDPDVVYPRVPVRPSHGE